MQTYQNSAPCKEYSAELSNLSPEVQNYILRLHDDSRVLRETFALDAFPATEVSATISSAFVHYLCAESIRDSTRGEYIREQLTFLHARINEAVNYLAATRK